VMFILFAKLNIFVSEIDTFDRTSMQGRRRILLGMHYEFTTYNS